MAQHFPRLPVKGPVVIPNCAEVQIVWTQSQMTLKNVFHGNLTAAGPLSPNIAESIFSALKANAATTTWLGHLATGISLAAVHVKDLRAPYNPTILSTGLSIAGSASDAALPQDCALVVTLRTAQSGKGFVGRTYLPGLTVISLQDSRHFVATLKAPAEGFVNAINSAMTAQGLPWVIGQRHLAANTDPAAPPSQQVPRNANVIPITKAEAINFRIDSQRKRLGR